MVHLSLLWILYYINEQNPNLLTSLPHTHNLDPPQSHFSLPSSDDGDASGLPMSDGDDEGERGRGPLDYLPDVEETAPGVPASSPTLPGGGGGDSAPGSAIAHPASEADTPKLRALGKRAVSPSGSTVVTEQAAAGATQLPPQGVEGAPEPDKGRSALVDAGAVPLPPPQSL